jgi:hypothetical protein
MNELIRAIFDSWNQFRLTRKSKRSAQLTFQQLSDLHELIRNKSIPDIRTIAIVGAGEIRVAGSPAQSNPFNKPTN